MTWIAFFLAAEDVARFQRLHDTFMLPMTEIHLLFYQSALQTFVHFNKFLQREDPLISVMCEQMNSFLTKLASKFLPVSTIKAAKGDFSLLHYKEQKHQKQGDIYHPLLCIPHYLSVCISCRWWHFHWIFHQNAFAKTTWGGHNQLSTSDQILPKCSSILYTSNDVCPGQSSTKGRLAEEC